MNEKREGFHNQIAIRYHSYTKAKICVHYLLTKCYQGISLVNIMVI